MKPPILPAGTTQHRVLLHGDENHLVIQIEQLFFLHYVGTPIRFVMRLKRRLRVNFLLGENTK